MVGIPDLTASASNLAVGINLVNGTTVGSNENAQVIDFTEKQLTVYTGYNTHLALNLDGKKGELISASGNFDLSVAGFVEAHGSMAFEKFQTKVTLADGESVTVDAMTLGGTHLNAFAGIGGRYFIDSNGNGLIDADDTNNPNTRGFVLEDAELALALLTPSQDVSRLNSLSWLGLQATANKISFVGGAELEMSVSTLQVEVNQVFGLRDGMDATDLVVDFAKQPMKIATGTGTTHNLNLAGDKGQLVRASADVQIKLSDFVYVGGSLGFEKSTQLLTLDNGNRISHDLLTVGGTDFFFHTISSTMPRTSAAINSAPAVNKSPCIKYTPALIRKALFTMLT
jgi:hypothetical protein